MSFHQRKTAARSDRVQSVSAMGRESATQGRRCSVHGASLRRTQSNIDERLLRRPDTSSVSDREVWMDDMLENTDSTGSGHRDVNLGNCNIGTLILTEKMVHNQHLSDALPQNSEKQQRNSKEYQLQQAEKAFCESTARWARQLMGERHMPVELDHNVTKVKLELASGAGMPATNTTFGDALSMRRRGPLGNVDLERIFDLARSNATEKANVDASNSEARERYICQCGNRVLIIGQAGIGKSTLCSEIAENVFEGVMLHGTQYVFYVRCREIDFTEKLTLFEFLFKYCLPDDCDLSEYTPDERNHIVRVISLSSHVLLLLDGFDEVQNEELTKSRQIRIKMHDCVEVSALFRGIMSGAVLSKAKVLVTSRPQQAFDMWPEYRPGAAIQILGLNTDSQTALGQSICGSGEWAPTYNFIRRDPDLESACYVPVFCLILYAVLHQRRHQSSETRCRQPELNTVTTVMTFMLNRYVRCDHMHNVATIEFLKVIRLARVSFQAGNYEIDGDDIDRAGISRSAYQAFMVTYLDPDTKLKYSIFRKDHRCQFSHKIWQEFFTAIDLMVFSSPTDFEQCTTQFGDSRWQLVSKFIYGLCNRSNVDSVLRMFQRNLPGYWQARVNYFTTQAELSAQQLSERGDQLLHISNFVQEANQDKITNVVAARLANQRPFLIKGSENEPLLLFNNDVCGLLRLIRAVAAKDSAKLSLEFDSVDFVGDSFRIFASRLPIECGTIFEIRLHECSLGRSAGQVFSYLLPRVERLHVIYCDLGQEEIALMKDQFFRLQPPMPEVWVFTRTCTYDFKAGFERFQDETKPLLV